MNKLNSITILSALIIVLILIMYANFLLTGNQPEENIDTHSVSVVNLYTHPLHDYYFNA
ncbi:MAG TPA: hypothetical protein QF753_02970 [Victivallales bacterium]|nr:hypothetical protein [Victivallales bacterium]